VAHQHAQAGAQRRPELSCGVCQLGGVMHTAWVRVNAVVFFGLTVLLVLSVLTALSTYLHQGFPDVRKLGVSKFRTFRKSEGTDRLLLNIDVDADLAPAFNWNVKQLFAFVVAEYETPTNPVNQASHPVRFA
ncbi:unnamed protein product, partial [Ectocarpus fasciculatus]